MAVAKKTETPDTKMALAGKLNLDIKTVQPYGPGFNYWELDVTLTGITPLLMHSPAAMWDVKPTTSSTRGKQIPSHENEARRGAYITDDGLLYVPAIAVRNCLIDGAGRGDFRIGRKPLKALLASALVIPDEQLILQRNGVSLTPDDYKIQLDRVVIQRAAIIRARANIAPGWTIQTKIYIDQGPFGSAESLWQIWELGNFAGHAVGILDWRPEKLGVYGQFRITIEQLKPLEALISAAASK